MWRDLPDYEEVSRGGIEGNGGGCVFVYVKYSSGSPLPWKGMDLLDLRRVRS